MKLHTLAMFLAVTPALYGCSADTTDYYFDGHVYDGATSQVLTDYKISLEFLDRVQNGKVESDGRYFMGPLTPFNDYTVTITANGYRAFLSANTMKLDDEQSMNDNSHDDTTHPDRSQYYDAYVYSTSATTDAATITVVRADGNGTPSGTITLKPTSSGAPFETSASDSTADGQVWRNSADLSLPTITREFTGGTIALGAGALTYGTTYAVTIEGTNGATFSGFYVAGIDGDTTFSISVAP